LTIAACVKDHNVRFSNTRIETRQEGSIV
jgi:hypothetical protein